MTATEGHTPGPFFFDQMICRRRDDQSLQPIAIPAAALDQADVAWVVDLLNKGTHFDAMLAALKGVYLMASGNDWFCRGCGAGRPGQTEERDPCRPGCSVQAVRDAIAKAKARERDDD